MSEWTDHVAQWKDCTKCPLGAQRDRICLGRGVIPAEIVFIGEAPGVSEDALGLPFKGPAGALLDQIIERALPSNTRFALTNLVACFPRIAKEAGDNEPDPREIEACRPRLREFVRLCHPRLIVLVGQLAKWQVAGQNDFALTRDEIDNGLPWLKPGKFIEFCDIVHPAAILRMPLAQKQMAVQRAIVLIRRAFEDMIGRG